MHVVFTEFALDQLDDIHLYISQNSYENRADAYIERVASFCRGLSTFPKRGHARDDLMPGCEFFRRVAHDTL